MATLMRTKSDRGAFMVPSTKVGRSWGRFVANVGTRSRESTKWWRERRRVRVARPPATPVTVEAYASGVTEIRLGAGERRNVLGRTTIEAIESAVVSPPPGTKILVLSAEAPDFCAGYDLVEAYHGDASTLIAHADNFAALRTSTVPVVAALSGNVIGGGLELALLADVRIATPDTKFAIPASKLGLVYSEEGTRLVVDAFGPSVARAMFLAGAVISSEVALARGVVVSVVGREQVRAEALRLAEEMAEWSEVATSGNRQVLDDVTGRANYDVEALHATSFVPEGELARGVERFAQRRANPTQ